MKLALIFLFITTSVSVWAGPRVIGNGFLAEKANPINDMENELNSLKTDEQKFGFLNDIATKYSSGGFAITKENSIKVKEIANKLLSLAEKFKNDWNYGNAIHHGNIVLGRVALSSGDVENSLKYLMLASKTKGSPQLRSFGPNMNLASELLEILEKEKREEIIKYIDACLVFWTAGVNTEERVFEWKARIRSGNTPDFKGNLYY